MGICVMNLGPTREESGKGVPRDEAIEEKCFELAMRLLDEAAAAKAPQSETSNASKRGKKGKKGKGKGKKGKEEETSNDVSSENDPFKIEHVFVVQYGALQALGLLLRSDIGLHPSSSFLSRGVDDRHHDAETFSNEVDIWSGMQQQSGGHDSLRPLSRSCPTTDTQRWSKRA